MGGVAGGQSAGDVLMFRGACAKRLVHRQYSWLEQAMAWDLPRLQVRRRLHLKYCVWQALGLLEVQGCRGPHTHSSITVPSLLHLTPVQLQ